MSKDLMGGLPDELQELMNDVDKASTTVEIKIERKKYGKFWAIISGLDLSDSELKDLMKTIKNRMACGGTTKGREIEILLGKTDKHKELIKILVQEGFNEDSIHVSS
ncbi:MAG: stress response translation initiation inhibitor YciH [Nanoarchaeota archaeon]|nr:stress response translation initiation inhibitor YciH [Nanoarchaeota archaeon]